MALAPNRQTTNKDPTNKKKACLNSYLLKVK